MSVKGLFYIVEAGRTPRVHLTNPRGATDGDSEHFVGCSYSSVCVGPGLQGAIGHRQWVALNARVLAGCIGVGLKSGSLAAPTGDARLLFWASGNIL